MPSRERVRSILCPGIQGTFYRDTHLYVQRAMMLPLLPRYLIIAIAGLACRPPGSRAVPVTVKLINISLFLPGARMIQAVRVTRGSGIGRIAADSAGQIDRRVSPRVHASTHGEVARSMCFSSTREERGRKRRRVRDGGRKKARVTVFPQCYICYSIRGDTR